MFQPVPTAEHDVATLVTSVWPRMHAIGRVAGKALRVNDSWRILQAGTIARTVLVVDFHFTSRPEANFGQFAEVSDFDHEIWQTTQPRESVHALVPAERS